MPAHPWLNQTYYPFASHYTDLYMGRMHYVDEGAGEPIVMLHGNPTWSFMYREVIKGLSDQYRCIAPDYLGFGLSDKPYNWTFRPEDHALNIQTLIETLDLRDITLLIHDWGGPIGMSYAVARPQNVKRLIVLNTFMWPLAGATIQLFSRILGGPLGRYLILNYNLFANQFMKFAHTDRKKFAQFHDHYTRPLATPQDRKGSWVFPRELLRSRRMLERIWSKRAVIADKPALFLWGEHDRGLNQQFLDRWHGVLPNHASISVASGHYVAEEKGAELVPHIREFMSRT